MILVSVSLVMLPRTSSTITCPIGFAIANDTVSTGSFSGLSLFVCG